MFLNFLAEQNLPVSGGLTDPSNTPAGVGGLDMQAVYSAYMALLGIVITIIAACLIGYLYRKAYPNGKKQTVTAIIVITTIIICIIFIALMLYIDKIE